jgi:hypothetical protein
MSHVTIPVVILRHICLLLGFFLIYFVFVFITVYLSAGYGLCFFGVLVALYELIVLFGLTKDLVQAVILDK